MEIVVIRLDAGTTLGAGHYWRCFAIAEQFISSGLAVVFVSKSLPKDLRERTALMGADSITISKNQTVMEDANSTAKVIARLEAKIVIVDHYELGIDWFDCVRLRCGNEIIYCAIDDIPGRKHDVDVFLDYTLGRTYRDYAHLLSVSGRILFGAKYCLIREGFSGFRDKSIGNKRKTSRDLRVLIMMGGTDPNNTSLIALKAIEEFGIDRFDKVDVVLASESGGYTDVVSLVDRLGEKVQLIPGSDNVAQLLVEADFAIGAAGVSSWERCLMGLPSLVVITAENQIHVAASLEQEGAIKIVGTVKESDTLRNQIVCGIRGFFSDEKQMAEMSSCAARIVDGRGAGLVVGEILSVLNGETIAIRDAELEDSEVILTLRNEATVRKTSRNQEFVSHDKHQQWFASRHDSQDCQIFMVESSGCLLGVTRFERATDNDVWEVTIHMCAESRGKGYGALCLMLSMQRLFSVQGIQLIEAEIRTENAASFAIFHRAGFLVKRESDIGKILQFSCQKIPG